MAKIVVTGGAGYIGSTTCKLLAAAGHDVTVYDNLSTGHRDMVLWGRLVEGDIRDTDRLAATLRETEADAVVHFAARAYVGESVADPGRYYNNNVAGTLSLLEAMRQAQVMRLVVSSTCAVYGQPEVMPISEVTPVNPINPYGASKLMMERMCADFEVAHGIRTVALRYFNACGTEAGLEVGEIHDPEPHVIPRILMAADGVLEAFEVFGTDYATADGSCIRDYIHVADLADAHCRAVDHLVAGKPSLVCNLGTGSGQSVFQLIEAARRVSNHDIPVRHHARRPGDPAELVADAARAREVLGWEPGHSDIDTIMQSAWAWYKARVSPNRRAESAA